MSDAPDDRRYGTLPYDDLFDGEGELVSPRSIDEILAELAELAED